MKKYRIVNRRRFITFVVTVIIVFMLITNYAFGIAQAASSTKTEYMKYEVVYGDTLWGIAETYMTNEDTREAVYEICKINSIKAEDLKSGMTLRIPV